MPRPILAISSNNLAAIATGRASLIAALQEAGYAIAALAPDGPGRAELEAMGVIVHSVPVDARGLSPWRDVATLLAYQRALKASGAAIFLGFTIKPNIYGSLAARSLGIATINNITGLGEVFARDGALARLVRMLYRAALRLSKTVFFQNADDRDIFRRAGLVTDRQARLLPGSGVDLKRFKPTAAAERSEKVVFLLAGRLLWDKGIREFVEAARRLREHRDDVEFRLLGPIEPASASAVPKEDVAAWERDGTIVYLGSVGDVRRTFAEADCIVLPSYYREGVPRVLLEAAAMGKPLITTDWPGCRDAVDDRVSGLLCTPRDAKSLAQAMISIADMTRTTRDAMGQAGRAKLERQFDEKIVHRAYLYAIAEALGSAA
jgi:glycosyltransferase involved in cell wall biosynthesis